jgi:nucleoside-diphosphate-sugar epimerase
MKVCVTGASGFLGQALVRELLAGGYEVVGIGRRPKPANLDIPYFQGDLSEGSVFEKALPGCEAIFHTAAKAGIWGPLESYMAANVKATRNALKAAEHFELPYFIHTSTASVVFNHQPLVHADESQPLGKHHLCAYTYTKALAEQIVLKAHNGSKLQTICLRPHLIWGKGDPHLFPRLIAKAQKKKLWQIGSGENWVDLTHVDNVAWAHVQALNAFREGRPIGGKPYFITQKEPVALWPWVNNFLKALKLPAVRRKASLKMAYRIGGFLEKIYEFLPKEWEPPLTRFMALELALTHTFNCQGASDAFGYAPKRSFADGMEEAIEEWTEKLSKS